MVRDELWLYTRGRAKQKLPLELPAPVRLSFDDAWGPCEKQAKQTNARTEVVRVSDFLAKAGVSSGLPLKRINVWTSKRGKPGLHKKGKGAHFTTQPWLGSPGRNPRVATKATLRKVWPGLWA